MSRTSATPCGTISSGTDDEITYTAPATIDGGVCEDTLTLTSENEPSLEDTIKIFVYDAVAITWPTEPAGIALGDTSYGVTALGGTEVYEFQGTDDAIATVDETTGAITTVAVGMLNAEVIDDTYGDFEVDNGYFDESAQIEIVNAIVITPTPANDTLESEGLWDFDATGGKDEGVVSGEREQRTVTRYTADDAAFMLEKAQSVVIIPGYGRSQSC